MRALRLLLLLPAVLAKARDPDIDDNRTGKMQSLRIAEKNELRNEI